MHRYRNQGLRLINGSQCFLELLFCALSADADVIISRTNKATARSHPSDAAVARPKGAVCVFGLLKAANAEAASCSKVGGALQREQPADVSLGSSVHRRAQHQERCGG